MSGIIFGMIRTPRRGKDRDSYCRFVCMPNSRLDWWYYRTEGICKPGLLKSDSNLSTKFRPFIVRFYLTETFMININPLLIGSLT